MSRSHRRNMQAIEIYQKHLDRVSRSFAACIQRLESPLRSWVSLTYLICRILDTVEDAKWKTLAQQNVSFQDFDKFLKQPETLDQVMAWAEQFPEGITEGEMLLIQDSQRIFSDLHKSPPQIKKVIQELVGSMSAGMRYFSAFKKDGAMRLNGLREVNQYCFFVAGIVGETLSKLLAAVDSRIKFSKNVIVDAHHFGLFLQKVNLLKDQFSDEKEGRFLIPSRENVLLSLRGNAEGAMRYIESIPLEQKGYRVFCLWSLFLGLRTLPILTKQNIDEDLNKISRQETLDLFQKIEDVAVDSAELRRLFDMLMSFIVWPVGEQSNVVELRALGAAANDGCALEHYQGSLEQAEFERLGLA